MVRRRSRATKPLCLAQPGEQVDLLYTRVSTLDQGIASQLPDLERWAAAYSTNPLWLSDTESGDRWPKPEQERGLALARTGGVARLIVWRLDRLGRTSWRCCQLIDELRDLGVKLISVTEGLDLSTLGGRLVAQVLSSMAEFELATIRARIRAGQEAARAAGRTIGGSKAGRHWPGHKERVQAILALLRAGQKKREIARVVGVSPTTVYEVARLLKGGTTNGAVQDG